MNPIDFPEANFTFTKPASMTDEECGSLRVHDTGEAFVSCWKPDADERRRIARGAPVFLCVVGRGHPPVMVEAVARFPSADLPPPPPATRWDRILARLGLQRIASSEELARG